MIDNTQTQTQDVAHDHYFYVCMYDVVLAASMLAGQKNSEIEKTPASGLNTFVSTRPVAFCLLPVLASSRCSSMKVGR